MINESEKKAKSWFKSVISNQNQAEKQVLDKQQTNDISVAASAEAVEELEQPFSENGTPIFSKENQDKIALDVIMTVETMLKDRQLLSYKNRGLEDQIASLNETVHRLKQDLIKKDNILQEKSKEIRELEMSLTNKQMSYDQLLEDYKEYQLTSNMEYEKISNQLETEIAKYNKLYDETSNTQYQNMLKINTLEDRVRSMEIENQKYAEQYQKIVNEKAELMKTINDFTEKMSFSFSAKAVTNDSTES